MGTPAPPTPVPPTPVPPTPTPTSPAPTPAPPTPTPPAPSGPGKCCYGSCDPDKQHPEQCPHHAFCEASEAQCTQNCSGQWCPSQPPSPSPPVPGPGHCCYGKCGSVCQPPGSSICNDNQTECEQSHCSGHWCPTGADELII